jgi:hypothetical protein
MRVDVIGDKQALEIGRFMFKQFIKAQHELKDDGMLPEDKIKALEELSENTTQLPPTALELLGRVCYIGFVEGVSEMTTYLVSEMVEEARQNTNKEKLH